VLIKGGEEFVTAQYFRSKLSRALDPEMRGEPGLSSLNKAVIAAICLSIVLAVLETEPLILSLSEAGFEIVNVILFALFGAEYAGRLYVAALNPKHGTALRYARTPAALLDLIVLASFALPAIGLEGAVLRMVRAARLVRLARLGRFSKAMNRILDAIRARRYELMVSVLAAIGLMLLSSTALYLVEAGIQPETFGSIPRAMWWSVATLTTVGYGDAVPVTVLGKLFATVSALAGVGIIAVPTGIMAGAFSEALRSDQRKV
jgi:voltage-gated potassium channel